MIEATERLDTPLLPEDRTLLMRSLAIRSQLLTNLRFSEKAESDLLWLAYLDPEQQLKLEGFFFSPRLAQLLTAVRNGLIARISLPPAVLAKTWIDGRRVDGILSFGIAPGEHELVIEDGNGPFTVTVAAVARQHVRVPVRRVARTIDTNRRLFRILTVRIDAAVEVNSPSFSGVSDFVLNGQPGVLNSTYVFLPPRRIDGPQFGGAIRLYKRLALGFTRTRTSGDFGAIVEATVSSTEGNRVSSASVEANFGGLRRWQEQRHIEITLASGDDTFEVAVFAGPSTFKVTQEIMSRVTFQDISRGRPTIEDGLSREVFMEHVTGGNIDVDVSWFSDRYIGVGVGLRYSWANATIVASDGETALRLGGAQLSAGARFRF